MIVAVALLGYAALLAFVIAPRLTGAAWTRRSPRLGVAAWQTLTAGLTVATVLGAIALAVPTMRVSADLALLLHACVMALRTQYSAPGGAALAATGAVLALAVTARVGWVLTAGLLRMLRQRRDHRDAVTVVGRADADLGVTVVTSDTPAVYCLPGRRRTVVVTTAALSALDDEKLTAVLAHERAHLRGRHDLVLAYACAMERAFPKLRAFRDAAAETALLIEMCADDAASSASGRLPVAHALLAIAAGPAPAAALGAGGSSTPARIRRLIDDPAPLHRRQRLAGTTGVGALLLLPLIIATGPAAAATGMNYCPAAQQTAAACPHNGDCDHRHMRDSMP
ncbi:MAG: M56 family metallopeptidase [Catenulispora sp.]|nr:M56 family metallopeptidase [Catenulispora sp.]